MLSYQLRCLFPSQDPPYRTPGVITDSEDRAIVTLVGSPGGDGWAAVEAGARAALTSVRCEGEEIGAFSDIATDRRGNFVALACGVSYGGGQEVSHYLTALFHPVI